MKDLIAEGEDDRRPYTIGALRKLTGVPESLIRAWENRYSAIKPRKKSSGHRLYSQADLERLELLASLTKLGHRIGAISSLTTSELKELSMTADAQEFAQRVPSRESTDAIYDIQTLILKLKALHIKDLQSDLYSIKIEIGLRAFSLNVAQPLMTEVGKLVASETLTVGHEHLVSALVRANLSNTSMKREAANYEGRGRKKFVIAGMEGDFHEIGLLIASVLVQENGFNVYYLGPNTPAAVLGQIASSLDASHIITAMPKVSPSFLPNSPERYLSELLKNTDDACAVWLGAGGNLLRERIHQNRIVIVPTLQQLDQLLS